MNQPATHLQHKFSLIPGSVSQLFLLLMVLLLVSMGLIVQSAVNSWLEDKSYQLTDITQQLHKRVETYRYVTWQIYDNIAVSGQPSNDDLQETRLRPDIYYLDKPRHKTEALIYGTHDASTLEMSDRISDYLDILWGAEQVPWSMYYLNGQDNSMVLLSTLPLKERVTSFKAPDIRSLLGARRTELLQQANALDVRESFSGLRFISWQNGYYFTLRTTFNQPGHLATVVAFDLPLNDLMPPGITPDSLQLSSDTLSVTHVQPADSQPTADHSVHISFNGSHIELTSPIATTRVNLIWQVTLTTLLADTLQDSLLPLVINVALLALVLFGYTAFRYPASGQQKTDTGNNALHSLRALNEEIIALLPIGLLVHDQETNRTLFSNKIADYLLPHMDLANISTLAEQHQRVIQATINNELYEIRLYYSQVTPNTQIFVFRDQDKELLVNSKLKQAQRLYEKNQHGRIRFMQHLSAALQQPLSRLQHSLQSATPQLTHTPPAADTSLHEALQAMIDMIEAIQLLSQLDSGHWQPRSSLFCLQQTLDELTSALLPVLAGKGLRVLMDNPLPPGEMRTGDPDVLRIMLNLLLQYAIATTQFGRITLQVSGDEASLTLHLLDTGDGVSAPEQENLHFPFSSDTGGDEHGNASGLAFYLCNQLAGKMGGQLTIQSQTGLGTHYSLTLAMPRQPGEESDSERLLDGMVAMVDVSAGVVRDLVTRRLTHWGACCITPDEKLTRQAYDIFFTDNPSNLTASGILLSDDDRDVQHYDTGKWRVNFNISRDMHEAVLQLIEEQLVMEGTTNGTKETSESGGLHACDYYPLFADTVPADVQKLYTEWSVSDFVVMAQTAHRLKGVFAMLNLLPGKQLCETLEHHIREKDAPAIEKDIGDIDVYIKRLLSQGSLHD